VLEFKKIVDTLIEKTEVYSKQVEAARLKVRNKILVHTELLNYVVRSS
jgi:hypothetical protein